MAEVRDWANPIDCVALRPETTSSAAVSAGSSKWRGSAPNDLGKTALWQETMSHSELTRSASFDVSGVHVGGTGSRVDPAHLPLREEPAPPLAAPAAIAPAGEVEPPVTNTPEQIRLQAAQLGALLEKQRSSVDHREAELNARNAAIENQVRAARLWLTEQHLDLTERRAEIERRERMLAEREARGAELDISATGRELPPRDAAELAKRQVELDRRSAELDALAGRLAEQLAAARSAEEVEQAHRAVELRSQNIERAEQLLVIERADLDHQRRALDLDRANFAAESNAERQRQRDDAARLAKVQEQAARDLARQSDELATRQLVLEQMRSDMTRSQQEVLEIRLATEELWARLCGTMAPAALTQSLAKIRLQLAEQHRLVRGELAQQKSEIQALSARLAEQHRKLAQRREDVEAWANARQQELSEQAGLLVVQEQRVAAERAEMRRKLEAWDSERFSLKQEIRRQLREPARAA